MASKSKHSKRALYYCPCVLQTCKGKQQKIQKRTIAEHFRKSGHEMVQEENLRKYVPSNSFDYDTSSTCSSESSDSTRQTRMLTASPSSSEGSIHEIQHDTERQSLNQSFDSNLDIPNSVNADKCDNEEFETDSDDLSLESDSSDSDNENSTKNDLDMLDGIETWEPDFNNTLFSDGIGTQKLYNGSNKTVLTALGERFATYTSTQLSKGCMSQLLLMEKETLPQPNFLPKNYYEARRQISSFLIPVRKYDACPNHCIVYRNSSEQKMYKELSVCPVCGTERYFKNKRSKRQIKYLPVGPRLARLFGNQSLAALFQREMTCDIQTQLTDIQDALEFRKLFAKDGYFEGDSNGIVVGLEADGVAPYHSYNQTYSFTVVTMPIFNLLRKVRMLFRNIFIVMIIPGDNKSEASTQDAYFEILVDELLYLTKYSYVHDYMGAPVKLKIKLLLYILDYPGFCKLFHLSGSGAISGCIWCHISGVRCKHLNKSVYLCNRSYLPEDHYLRESSGFPNPDEPKTKPKLRTQLEYDSYTSAYSRAFNKAQAGTISSATGAKGPTH